MIEQRHTPRLLHGTHGIEDDAIVQAVRADSHPEAVSCPTCGRNDGAGKASVIARSGRGRFVLEDGSSAMFQSELAGLLAEPTQPRSLPASGVIAALVVGWLLLAVDFGIVAGLRYQDYVDIPAASLDVATWLGLAWFGFFIPGAAILRYLASKDRAERETPAWRYAVDRWHRLHYCSRDDVVFIPGEEGVVAPEHASLLLLPLTPAAKAEASAASESRRREQRSAGA